MDVDTIEALGRVEAGKEFFYPGDGSKAAHLIQTFSSKRYNKHYFEENAFGRLT